MKRDRAYSFDLSADDRLDLGRVLGWIGLLLAVGIIVNVVAAARVAGI